MISSIQRKIANEDLKKILAEFQTDYDHTAAMSRQAYIGTLAPGSQLPAEGKIYLDNYRQTFKKSCQKYQDKVHSILDNMVGKLKADVTAAPSTDAVNTITLLNMRDRVGADEIADLMNAYGSNAQAYKALYSVAVRNGIHDYAEMTPTEATLKGIEDLGRSLDKTLTLDSAERGGAFLSWMGMTIDEALPVE